MFISWWLNIIFKLLTEHTNTFKDIYTTTYKWKSATHDRKNNRFHFKNNVYGKVKQKERSNKLSGCDLNTSHKIVVWKYLQTSRDISFIIFLTVAKIRSDAFTFSRTHLLPLCQFCGFPSTLPVRRVFSWYIETKRVDNVENIITSKRYIIIIN